MASSPIIIDPASQLILPPSARGPLVRVARVKWERDPEMSELIDYFDEPRFHGPKIKSDADRFALLTVREVQTIQGIIEKCRASFSYAARNFFWITTKSRGDQLFKLWESQELIYQELMRLKAKGLHQKIQILKARQLGSLLPDTHIVTNDLRSIFLGDVEVGNTLMSVEEYPSNPLYGRKLSPAIVKKKWWVEKEAYLVQFSNGSTLTGSDDHPFLRDGDWATVANLKAGDVVSALNDGFVKIVGIESVGLRRMVDIETTTGTFIAEGVVTHNCSTLIEGLIAWRSMFFRNVNAVVVSYDADHAADLFAIMQRIFDSLPWWLKPQCSSREYKDGLTFSNPDYDQRRQNPGLNSGVKVYGANKRTGVGTGTRISAFHGSEYSLWHPDYARDVIEQDIGNALAEDDPEMFAILESTARGAGTYAHRLWNKNVELGDQAEWHPIFLPWFFESTRVLAPPRGWRPEPPEITMNERVQVDWLRCDNDECRQYHERYHKTADREGIACATCNAGTLKSYSLADGQMYWMQRKRKNAQKDAESLKKLQSEQASTAESAWALSGTPVFGEGAQEYVNSCVRPPLKEGFLDKDGNFHGADPKKIRLNPNNNEYYEACYVEECDQDHSFGDHNGETPYQVWREPEKDAEYCVGADVSEGLGGEFDYSVGAVMKINRRGGQDEVVALFRSNLIDPIAFAQVLNFIGRSYNCGLMAVEVNRYDSCMSWMRFQLQYPNLYQRKYMDLLNPVSNKIGWVTSPTSKPRLYQTLKRWLQHKLILVYSRTFAEEIKTFTKDEDERSATAEGGSHDDTVMAVMLSLYCAHEGDWDDSLGQMNVKRELTMDSAPWHMACSACQLIWPSHSNTDKNCPRCGCMVISGKANRDPSSTANQADGLMEGLISRQDAKEFSVSLTEGKGEEEPDYSVPFVCG